MEIELWLTLVVGDSRIQVYLPGGINGRAWPRFGEAARRPDEKGEDYWNGTLEKPSRLIKIGDSLPRSLTWGARCLLDSQCQDCQPAADGSTEGGQTYLRSGKIVSICDKHVQYGDLRAGVEDARTEPMSPKDVAEDRRRRIRDLRAKGYSTRKIAVELGISQSAVEYHLKD
ncbi:MAG TPA: hypothetical protein VGR56_02700 [Nitrososphaerales archaeon]|nr:hypothetical protein [Nitrososphaerales archaeon]